MHNEVIAAGEIEISPAQLIEFESIGRLLLIGRAEQIAAVLPSLATLDISCSCVDGTKPVSDISYTMLKEPVSAIDGWLGAFNVDFVSGRQQFDLVLDLSDEPLIARKVKPLGYFAPADDAQVLAQALQQLPELTGIFDKPKFFNYKPSICAHSRRGVSGCQQCLDACPAEAISSAGETIEVNPSLCQGCGSCTAVCPSGAISYALPTLDVSINRLRKMLQQYFSLQLESAPHILIHDLTNGQALLETMGERLAADVIPFSIEEIGALGMPFWLTSFAYGAASVMVWDAGSHSDHDWQELQAEIAHSNHLLAGLGYGDSLINWYEGHDVGQMQAVLAAIVKPAAIERAQYAGVDDKRRMITMALEHLHQQAPTAVDVLPLEKGAAFGQINVNTGGCTLCMSCVSVCPAGAVLDGVDKPQLNFIEDLCVQCGMCQTACPEKVISLQPRYLFSRDQARQKRLLHEEAVFNCISCDKPFATQKMIDTMMQRLKGHAMFQGKALERLKMCEDCRVKAMFKDSQGPM